MPDNQAEPRKEAKEISRREFLTGTSGGAVSFGVFANPIAKMLDALTSKIPDPKARQEQNKRMLEQAKRKPPEKKTA